ncbi:MAG: radical SAM protein [Candidatus Margulisbacteria bacterium]|nr:radical SAM protein [Candidatus Margulisiibacteriota bacterium]
MQKKVLLLNPPGDQHYLRDYFCSKISKSGYLYQSIDLLVLSGILSRLFEVRVIDSIVENDSIETAFKKITDFNPDFLVFLTGSVSFSLDMRFIERLRQAVPAIKKAVGLGDVFFDDSHKILKEHACLDAVLFDFTTDDITNYLTGRAFKNIVYRDGAAIKGQWLKPHQEEFSIPVPRHDLFPNNKYNYPFVRRKPFTIVLTNFGCPFRCRFCIMPALGFKVRRTDNIIEELEYLKAHGFKDIYFNDQTFGADKPRTKQLLRAMIEKKLNLGWVCFSRVDLIDQEFVALMKKAGCHTIMFGIESADQNILDDFAKGITLEKIKTAVALCKKSGLRILGTFILGLPGETEKSALKTIEFAKELDLDYAAFNIAIPRKGTELRRQALESGLIGEELIEMDQSGSKALMKSGGLSETEIEKLQRRAYRDFYFRPKKIIGFILGIRSWVEFNNYVKNGWEVLWRYIRLPFFTFQRPRSAPPRT